MAIQTFHMSGSNGLFITTENLVTFRFCVTTVLPLYVLQCQLNAESIRTTYINVYYVTYCILEQGLDMTFSSQLYLTPDELVIGTF
jgi:hypothetical protein